MRTPYFLFALPLIASCGGTDPNAIPTNDASTGNDGTVADSASDGNPTNDGSPTDGSTIDGPVTTDGGIADGSSNPGLIDCLNGTCTAGSQVCCVYPPDGGSITPDASLTRACTPSQSCPGPQVRCDEKADCPNNGLCCFTSQSGSASLGTQCAPNCGNAVQVCKTNQECGGGNCGTYACGPAGTVHACSKPLGCN